MLWVWLLVLVALFGALLALLAIPVELAFAVERRERTRGRIALRWLFVRWQTSIPSERRAKKARARTKKPRAEREKPRRTRKRALAALRTRGLLSRSLALLEDLLEATHPHDVHLRVRLGTGDPAETGRLWGALGPASSLLASVRRADLSLEPDFFEESLVVEARGRLAIVPLQLLALLLAFALSPVALRAAIRAVRA